MHWGSVAVQGLAVGKEIQNGPQPMSFTGKTVSGREKETDTTAGPTRPLHQDILTGLKNNCVNLYLDFRNRPNFPHSWAVCCVVQDLTVS